MFWFEFRKIITLDQNMSQKEEYENSKVRRRLGKEDVSEPDINVLNTRLWVPNQFAE